MGAGIVGAACAYFLAQEGLRVSILDSSYVGGGTTAAAMGHITVMGESEAQLALTSYSVRLWQELAAESGSVWENDPCGTLWVAAEEAELELLEKRARLYRERGVAASELTSQELGEAEPMLRSGLAGGLLVPGDGVIYPPAATRWLVERALMLGAVLHEGCAVRSLGPRSVVTANERLEADVVVNAAGAQAGALTPELSLEPRKGHLVVTDRYPGFCRHQLVELGYLDSAHSLTGESIAFNVQPRRTHQILVGSSRELVGWDRRINHQIVARMVRRACQFLPRLSELNALRVWVGFRPAVSDHLPLIGRWSKVEGQWVAAGHEGLGITMALATGRLLSDLIVGRAPEIDPRPFDPERRLDKN